MKSLIAVLVTLLGALSFVMNESTPAFAASVTALQTDSATVSLTWTAPADTDLDHYEAIARSGGGLIYKAWHSTGGTATSHSFKLARQVSAYNPVVCVRAVDAVGLTGPETCTTVVIPATDTAPGAVTGLVATVTL